MLIAHTATQENKTSIKETIQVPPCSLLPVINTRKRVQDRKVKQGMGKPRHRGVADLGAKDGDETLEPKQGTSRRRFAQEQ